MHFHLLLLVKILAILVKMIFQQIAHLFCFICFQKHPAASSYANRNNMNNLSYILIFSSRDCAWTKIWKSRFPCWLYLITLLSYLLTITFLLVISKFFNFDLLFGRKTFMRVSKCSLINFFFISLPYISDQKILNI